MKKFFVSVMFICNMAQTIVAANEHPADSLLSHHMQEVEIISTRARRTTPVAFTNIGKEEIEKRISDKTYLIYCLARQVSSRPATQAVVSATQHLGLEAQMPHE